MGIKDLRPFLEETCLDLIHEIPVKKLAGTTIAVDILGILYKYLRSVGEENWIHHVIQNLSLFSRNGVSIVCVFDGMEVPQEKIDLERPKREKSTQMIEKKIKDIKVIIENVKKESGPITDQNIIKQVNDILAKQRKIEGYNIINFNKRSTILWVLNESLHKWEKQTIKVTSNHINTTKELCKILRIPVYQAKGEGETVCACLCLGGKVDAVYTEDTDILAYGCPVQLYGLNVKKGTLKLVYLEDALNGLGFDYEQFLDFCIMLGCDYNERVPGVGVKKSYDLLKECDFIEGILDANPMVFTKKINQTACKNVQKNYTYLNYENCRKYFAYRRVANVKWRSLRAIDYNEMNVFLKKHNLYNRNTTAETLLDEKDWKPTKIHLDD